MVVPGGGGAVVMAGAAAAAAACVCTYNCGVENSAGGKFLCEFR